MIKKNNKTCICCQIKYTFCPNCSDFDHLPRWMGIYHDENCKKICNTVLDYDFKHITKEQAKYILDKCDLSKKDVFNNRIKQLIDEIYITEDMMVSAEVLEKTTVEEKPVKMRKRKAAKVVNEE